MREKAVVVSSQNLPKMCESFHSPFQNSLFLTLPMLTLTFGWNISIKIGTLTLEVKIINPSMMAAAAGWNLPIHFYSGRMRMRLVTCVRRAGRPPPPWAASCSWSCRRRPWCPPPGWTSRARRHPPAGRWGSLGHRSWAAELQLEWDWF